MPAPLRKILLVLWAAILGIAIALIPQGIWSALIVLNLRTSAAIPWSVPAMAILLWLMWQYLGGAGPPRSTAESRRRSMRGAVALPLFAHAVLAGALAIVALDGFWCVMARIVRMPGSVLPDLSKYPAATAMSMVAMGALVSPICEQAGLRGYCQTRLEREFSPLVAVLLTAVFFGVFPHPPMPAPMLPKVLFFFLTGVTFGALAFLTGSVLPGLVVHIGGILSFFTLVWPADPARPLVGEQHVIDAWFVIHVAQTIVFGIASLVAFARLTKVPHRRRVAKISFD